MEELTYPKSSSEKFYLNENGTRIYLDRYALKNLDKSKISVGNLVVACIDGKTGRREPGWVVDIFESKEDSTDLDDQSHSIAKNSKMVSIEFKDGKQSVPLDACDLPIELDPMETMNRSAAVMSSVEKSDETASYWFNEFMWLFENWKFLPGGRILHGAGVDGLSLFNCFVIPSPYDSRKGIIDCAGEMMEIMSRGGGVGINISTLRPKFSIVFGVNGRSSGPASFSALYSLLTSLTEQGGSRRGALMLILNDWHPDVLDFISMKSEEGAVTNANISVGISHALMEAIRDDKEWKFMFPDTKDPHYDKEWDGDIWEWNKKGYSTKVWGTIKARDLWNKIIQNAWYAAEPGLFFYDRANEFSNSYYYKTGKLICTNPCGEQPLPKNSVCDLGALNLPKFLKENKFHEVNDDVEKALDLIDWDSLERALRGSIRFLDNVIDATPHVTKEIEKQQTTERRVGLGSFGLGELLIKLGLRYGSNEACQFLDKLYEFIAEKSYEVSSDIAAEKGSFAKFNAKKFLASKQVQRLSDATRQKIEKNGIRNVTLLTQAPNGTGSTMLNTSNGIEPFIWWEWVRNSRVGTMVEKASVINEWIALKNIPTPGEDNRYIYVTNSKREDLPDYYYDKEDNIVVNLPYFFVNTDDLTPDDHVKVQATLQYWVDSSISKTVNMPAEASPEAVARTYEGMYWGVDIPGVGLRICKGGTVYRPNWEVRGAVLTKAGETKEDKEKFPITAADLRIALPNEIPTIKKRYSTPFSSVHIHTGFVGGQPVEMFINSGKNGNELRGLLEALGRIISLGLQCRIPPTLIADQLEGIQGELTLMVPGRPPIKSIAELAGYTLKDFSENPPTQIVIPTDSIAMELPPAIAKSFDREEKKQVLSINKCPNCGHSVIIVEGCRKCTKCDWSKCG